MSKPKKKEAVSRKLVDLTPEISGLVAGETRFMKPNPFVAAPDIAVAARILIVEAIKARRIARGESTEDLEVKSAEAPA